MGFWRWCGKSHSNSCKVFLDVQNPKCKAQSKKCQRTVHDSPLTFTFAFLSRRSGLQVSPLPAEHLRTLCTGSPAMRFHSLPKRISAAGERQGWPWWLQPEPDCRQDHLHVMSSHMSPYVLAHLSWVEWLSVGLSSFEHLTTKMCCSIVAACTWVGASATSSAGFLKVLHGSTLF